MTDANGLAARLVSELRSPLSRVELGVSQLRRELETPTTRELAAGISEAVSQADREIDRILAILAPLSPPRRSANLLPVLERLRNRVAPALEARGTRLEIDETGAASLRADPLLVEQAVLGLVRVASSLVGTGGRLSLTLAADGPRLVVVVGGRAAEDRGPAGNPGPAFASLLPWVLRHRGELSSVRSASGWKASLWLPGEQA